MYEFKLKQEQFDINDNDGSVMATIIVRQATAEENYLMASISEAEHQFIVLERRRKAKESENKAKEPHPKVTPAFDMIGTLRGVTRDFFRVNLYPRLVACAKRTDGERLPNFEELIAFPSSEQEKWYAAASRVNPEWFDAFKLENLEKIKDEISKGTSATVAKYKKKIAEATYIHKQLGRLLPVSNNVKISTLLRTSKKEFDELYPLWLIWRSVDCVPSEFVAAMSMPSGLLQVFQELDAEFTKMEINRQKDLAKQR